MKTAFTVCIPRRCDFTTRRRRRAAIYRLSINQSSVNLQVFQST